MILPIAAQAGSTPRHDPIWESSDGRYRIVAHTWAYEPELRDAGGRWRAAGDWREEGAVLDAVAAWLDDQERGGWR